MHDRILFVVLNHLEMVRYANKFDLDDPEVIEGFAKFVEGEQRLRFYIRTPTVMPMQLHLIYGTIQRGMHNQLNTLPYFTKEHQWIQRA